MYRSGPPEVDNKKGNKREEYVELVCREGMRSFSTREREEKSLVIINYDITHPIVNQSSCGWSSRMTEGVEAENTGR